MSSHKSPRQEFLKSVKEAANKPWKHNWDEDKQPGNCTIDGYMVMAHGFRLEMLNSVKKLMADAPNALLKDDRDPPHYQYYKLSDMDRLIAELQANPSDTRFLKSKRSAEHKLTDPKLMGDPANIGDYLRFQILCTNVEDIVALRSKLMAPYSPVTSYKDQFRRPCEDGGHRAFKFHMEFGARQNRIVAEGQICHKYLEEFDAAKNLRGSERSLSGMFRGVAALKGEIKTTLLSAMNEATGLFQAIRRAANHTVSTESGLDALLDPDISPQKLIDTAIEELNAASPKALRLLSRSRSIGSALGVLPDAFHQHLH